MSSNSDVLDIIFPTTGIYSPSNTSTYLACSFASPYSDSLYIGYGTSYYSECLYDNINYYYEFSALKKDTAAGNYFISIKVNNYYATGSLNFVLPTDA